METGRYHHYDIPDCGFRTLRRRLDNDKAFETYVSKRTLGFRVASSRAPTCKLSQYQIIAYGGLTSKPESASTSTDTKLSVLQCSAASKIAKPRSECSVGAKEHIYSMLKTLRIAGRDRHRLEEIIGVTSRFGLGVLLAKLGLERPSPDSDTGSQSLPRRTRLALEELGPTFVKLGQILATRNDILPPDWIAELETLHSQAPTLPFSELRPQIAEALGQDPEDAFASIDETPLAAASMAQVHRAVLLNGRAVVLKIRRPGIRSRVEADLRLIAHLAALSERASTEVRRFAPVKMVRQLADAMLKELDFTTEGRNADLLRSDFANNPRVIVPTIHWEWTSETLLVMDFIAGVQPRDGQVLRDAGIDPDRIANLAADMVLEMVLVNGRFHADPHPGNLLCLTGDRLALLDLGMVGYVSPRRREEFISFVHALGNGNPTQLADVLMSWSAESDVSAKRVLASSERLIERHGSGSLVLSAMVADFFTLMREQRMTMPPDLLLIFKALVTMDGVLSNVQPDFNLTDAIRRSPFRIFQDRLSPGHWSPIAQAVAWELIKIGDDAPRLIRAAVRRLEGNSPEAGNSSVPSLRDELRLIAGSLFAGCALIAGALWWG